MKAKVTKSKNTPSDALKDYQLQSLRDDNAYLRASLSEYLKNRCRVDEFIVFLFFAVTITTTLLAYFVGRYGISG